MEPPFSRNQDLVIRAVFRLLVAGFVVAGITMFALGEWNSGNSVGHPVEQPVPFSHQHHAGELGIDCRYCHRQVDTTAFAGMPDTHTCMTCHSQVWTDAKVLEPVRESYRTGKPIAWKRVHDLADFVYFDHSAHIANGIDCTRCHGQVDTMPLTWQDKAMTMEWCLECHATLEGQDYSENTPEEAEGSASPYVDPHYYRQTDSDGVNPPLKRMENCSVCHR